MTPTPANTHTTVKGFGPNFKLDVLHLIITIDNFISS